jgi:hypothetical protein
MRHGVTSRPTRRIGIPGIASVLALAFASCATSSAPTPVPAPSAASPDKFKGALLPLDVDLAWSYEDASSPGTVASVTTVVGEDKVGDQPVRMLQLLFAEASTVQLACYVRDGDVWVAAIDTPGPDGWHRDVLGAPQLYQPGAGERTWREDFHDGPAAWSFTGDWHQEAGGEAKVLGQSRPTWKATGTLSSGSDRYTETDTLVDQLGFVRIELAGNGFTQLQQLKSLTHLPASLVGSFYGRTAPARGRASEWALVIDGPGSGRLVTPDGESPVSDLSVRGRDVTISATIAGSGFRWTGRIGGGGLSGIAVLGGERFVLDLRPRTDL